MRVVQATTSRTAEIRKVQASPVMPRVIRKTLLALPAILFLFVFFVLPLVDNSLRSFVAPDGSGSHYHAMCNC
jgi:ABC-type sugar transport system permease subunit